MDVLYLTEERISFSGTVVRGGQIHVERVVRGLRERGHEVSLVDRNSDPERPFQYSVAPLLRFGVDPARVFVRAVSVGRYADADVVVSKTRKTYLPGVAAARALGVPHVVHVGSSLDRPVAGPYDRVNAASFAARLRAPHDGYFVVCDHIGEQLRERGGRSRPRLRRQKRRRHGPLPPRRGPPAPRRDRPTPARRAGR